MLDDWSSPALLISELTWLVALLLAGWRLGGGWWIGAVLALAFAGGFVAVWATWMAPRAARRLDVEGRELVLILLGSGITVIGASAGLFIPSVLASVLVVIAHRRHNRLTH